MRILVVEDDEELNRMLSLFLERHGYEVHSAADALQALDTLTRTAIDMVITDLMMPHMDGTRFTETLKADPRHKDMPVIVVTASLDEEAIDSSMRKGAAFVLNKPLDLNRLLALVKFAE